jgi:hypothetical protein
MVQFVKLNYSASEGCGHKLVFVILTAAGIGKSQDYIIGQLRERGVI